ncbi:MAG: DinB family protein [Thermoanaerobaculia bacterium]
MALVNVRDDSSRAESGRPASGEFAAYAQPDIDRVEGHDAVSVLTRLRDETVALFERFSEEESNLTYAPGKWSLKQILGHLSDDERIFAYRALCIARGDSSPLPGFDENAYMEASGFERRILGDVIGEYRSVRDASITLFRGLDPEGWLRRGMVNGYQATPRGLAFHIAGHELHHRRVVVERYLPLR